MFRIIAVTVLLAGVCSAQEILFTDDFNDGNADGWIEAATGAQYEVNQQQYRIFAGSGVQYGSTFNADGPAGMSTGNYSIYVKFTTHDPTHGAIVWVRASVWYSTGYFIYLRTYQDQIRICVDDGMGWTNLTQEYFPFEHDQYYWTRFMCSGDSLMARVWQGELTDEPTEWHIAAEDSSWTTWEEDYFGLGAANVSGQTGFDTEFDDVMVIRQYLAFEAVTWAGIKAFL